MKRTVYFFACLAFASILDSCSGNKFITSSGLRSEDFRQKVNGEKTALYKISNKNGLEACITNYGARVVSLMVPDRNGKLEDIVCGFPDINGYLSQPQNYGATVGRYIGRILHARYVLDGKEYCLQANHTDGHTAHGGDPNFGARMWKVQQVTPSSVTLTYLSPDGENGFPGNLKVKLTYTVTEANALDIRYETTTDKPTVINLCNHSFFNLSGNLNSSVENQIMWVDADYFTPYDKKKCVTGELWPVKSTPLDFTQPHAIGRHINDEYGQLQVVNGYDHAWALRSPGDDSRPAAWIYDENSGRKMEIYTTEPAVHIYTGNGLKGKVKGKNDICYPFRGAVCFETCHFQDSPNNPQFPSTTLRPGEVFQSHTVYKFTTD
ncbi:aldose 1-epimerase [Bacteroides sp. CAG:1076]|nr:aldose 1-epimerase [Bacteroides sp. CAG:1076]